MSSTQVSSVSPNRPAAPARKSRAIPFVVALAVCTSISVTLGFGAWYLFGKDHASPVARGPVVLTEGPPPTNRPTEAGKSAPPAAAAPAGTVVVAEGVVELAGGEGSDPARKVAVKSFYVAETEVTNEEYREFVRETGRKAPAGWNKDDFPLGSANMPVTKVTWQDAVDFCQWLSKKKGMTVRLPDEAEWELAARGGQNLKYPWGNEWAERAAASEKVRGWVHAVKSYPAGRSPSGAYDMAGNVWEWTAEEARGSDGNPLAFDNIKGRVIKGGAANEKPAFISATSRDLVPENYESAYLGFRYVVAPGDAPLRPE